ncbi:MAG TPA: hypothetical protein VGN97_21490 [Mesorhizobium sp.]|nr:hypothetical protein [Mesorhizobium sp.]
MMKSVIAGAAALLLAAPAAYAQTEVPLPAPPPAAPATQAEPSLDPAAGADAAALDAPEASVEVSLGRPEVKEQVAQAMGVTTVDVPLTIRVTLDVAREVCGQEVFDSTTDTNRSCTATHFAPTLVDAAREGLRTQADELGLEQPAQ